MGWSVILLLLAFHMCALNLWLFPATHLAQAMLHTQENKWRVMKTVYRCLLVDLSLLLAAAKLKTITNQDFHLTSP